LEAIIGVIVGVFLGFFAASSDEKASVSSADSGAIDKTCSGSVPEREECVIRLFKDTQEASILRGKLAYHHYCYICQGSEYDGKGRAAKFHTPRPTNLKLSGLPPEYAKEIIIKGGEGVGRYKGMPPWGEQLTDEQLKDVVNFVISVRTQP
jgi:cytochrome c1